MKRLCLDHGLHGGSAIAAITFHGTNTSSTPCHDPLETSLLEPSPGQGLALACSWLSYMASGYFQIGLSLWLSQTDTCKWPLAVGTLHRSYSQRSVNVPINVAKMLAGAAVWSFQAKKASKTCISCKSKKYKFFSLFLTSKLQTAAPSSIFATLIGTLTVTLTER